MSMINLNEKLLKILKPYEPGFQPEDKGVIKLNTNENPYTLEKGFLKNLKFSEENLRKYPSSDGPVKEVAKYFLNDKNADDKVFIGNGSDEVLAFCLRVLFNPDKKIKIADITYSFYQAFEKLFDLKFDIIPLKEMKYDVPSYFNSEGGVILVNPNAPTGELLELKDIEEILRQNKDVPVLVDEAYIDFSVTKNKKNEFEVKDTALSLIDKYPNLLVVRTVSKSFSLAGLRAGFALGNSDLINAIKKVKNSFNSYPVSAFTSSVIKNYLNRPFGKLDSSILKIIKTREWFIDEIKKMNFEVLPSAANFVLVKSNNIEAKILYEKLKKAKIFIRYFETEKLKEYLRITIGTDEQMRTLIKLIKKITGIYKKSITVQ